MASTLTSAFVDSCITVPRDPGTRLPTSPRPIVAESLIQPKTDNDSATSDIEEISESTADYSKQGDYQPHVNMNEFLHQEIVKLKGQQKELQSVLQRLCKEKTSSDTDQPANQSKYDPPIVWTELEKFSDDDEEDGVSHKHITPPLSIDNIISDTVATSTSSSTTTLSDSENVQLEGLDSEEEEDSSAFQSPAVEMIKSMWDDFSVETYTFGGTSPERSMAKTPNREWRPRTTIPEPFSMTIRDQEKVSKKSRVLERAVEERHLRELEEELECSKQFQANPMPPSTCLPLYEIIMARNEQRRRQVRDYSKAILKSQEKPFSFVKRENEKKKRKQVDLEKKLKEGNLNAGPQSHFKAKPIPKSVYDGSINEKILEEEVYRKIRIQMRAEELMSQSKLPGTMQERRQASKSHHQMSKSDQTAIQFQPDINGSVPNFTQSHVSLQKKLRHSKDKQHATVQEPFFLRTELIPSKKDKIKHDMMTDDVILPETRWPFVAPRRKVYSVLHKKQSTPSYSIQKTHTAALRETVTKEKLMAIAAQEKMAEEDQTMKKKREAKIKKDLADRVHDYNVGEQKRQKMLDEKYTAFK